MVLEALEVPYKLNVVDLENKKQKEAEYLKINPKGQVPAITVGDFCLAESRAIATYLCNEYADDKHNYLYPVEPKARAKVDRLLYLSEQMIDALRSIEDITSYLFGDGMLKEDYSEVDKVVASFENEVEGKYLTGENVTVADMFVYVYATFADTFKYDWSPYPKLKAVLDNVKSLSYHDKVNEACFTKLMNLVEGKICNLKINST